MKKVLLVVALLLLATPVFAADVTISASVGSVVNPGEANELMPVTVSYTQGAPGAISAFALRMTTDVGALDHIRGFKVGESNGAVPGGSNGYGIFPGKFRANVVVYNGRDANYNFNDYNPVAPYGDFNSGGYQGSPNLVMELGTLYDACSVGDSNKPDASGTLFVIDVNSHRGYINPADRWRTPDCNVCIVVEQSRGGVVKADATAASVTLPGTAGCFKVTFPCVPGAVPDLSNMLMVDANTAIVNALYTVGTITYTSDPVILAGHVISQNPAAGVVGNCNDPVAYVVSTGSGSFVISGRVVGAAAPRTGGIGGVRVVATTGSTVYTDAAGNYSITCSGPGTCTVSDPNSQWTFVPASWSYSGAMVQNVTGTATECMNKLDAKYSRWVSYNKPDCWCYQKQCKGDADGANTLGKPVAGPDLTIFKAAVSLAPTSIKTCTSGGKPCICADFDRADTLGKPVAGPDLTIFKSNVGLAATVVPQCPSGTINAWKN